FPDLGSLDSTSHPLASCQSDNALYCLTIMSLANTPVATPVVKPNRRFKPKEIATKLLLLAVSTGVGLLLLEGAVRIVLPAYNPRARIVYYINDDGVSLGPANA